MNEILLFLLLGLGTGATIAAIAVAVVVTYRGSGFINLAAGAIAMVAGFSFWALRTGELGFTVGTPLAVALSYVVVVLLTVAIELAVSRPLRTAAPLAKLVASLGVLLTLQATMLLAFGTSQHPQPTIIPIRVVRLLDGVSYALAKPSVTIGRLPECDVVVDDPGASRQHARIRRTESGFVLTDLGSTNSTMVNGEPIQEHVLEHGDRITIGETELEFRSG